MLGYLLADIIYSENDEQIMSKDKYPSIFSPQMATLVFIILQIFFATSAVFKIGYSSVLAGEYSVTGLNQSSASKNI